MSSLKVLLNMLLRKQEQNYFYHICPKYIETPQLLTTFVLKFEHVHLTSYWYV